MQEFPNIEIEIHSTNHVDFTSHSQEIIQTEIQQCIADFCHELERNPRHFAFPYNRHNFIVRELVQELELTSAVTQSSGREVLIQEGADLLALPRIEPLHSATLFRLYTSGAFPGLLKAFLGRVT